MFARLTGKLTVIKCFDNQDQDEVKISRLVSPFCYSAQPHRFAVSRLPDHEANRDLPSLG